MLKAARVAIDGHEDLPRAGPLNQQRRQTCRTVWSAVAATKGPGGIRRRQERPVADMAAQPRMKHVPYSYST